MMIANKTHKKSTKEALITIKLCEIILKLYVVYISEFILFYTKNYFVTSFSLWASA